MTTLAEIQRISDILIRRLLEELGNDNSARGIVILAHTMGRLCGVGGLAEHGADKYWDLTIATPTMKEVFRNAFNDERRRVQRAVLLSDLVTSLTDTAKDEDPDGQPN